MSSSSTQLAFEAKKGFVLSQIRILSQDTPTRLDWRDEEDDDEEGAAAGFSDAVVENVLQKVNRLSRRHCQIFYSSQGIDHVSEQIEVLYQQRTSGRHDVEDVNVLSGRLDLSDVRNIERLPESWPSKSGSGSTDEDALAYEALVGRLASMAEGITNIRLRHKRLLAVRKKLEVLANPSVSIQPNLVAKDGELALELKRMRVLAARLANELETSQAVAMLKGRSAGAED
ncbi:hypothetical protein DRE_04123 [Drechslerella stenobrocha 248]|uniref:Uncharacterized protein n=1 Tax=Drechslerella stenobrocha 248 TaxID=1043628 RepID=W7HRG7_9PEZI|nr:hypothetical protein DRE_04123 [Drechslerella stenobrocha 248]